MRATHLHQKGDFLGNPALAKHQNDAWQRQRRHLLQHAPFVLKQLNGGVLPHNLQDLVTVPLCDKAMLRKDQAHSPPFGTYLSTPLSAVSRLHRTSGTTGQAMNIALSQRDALLTAQIGARSHIAAGLKPHHKVVHCLNYQMWMGGLTDHLTLEQAGALVIPFGVGSTELLIETIEQLQIDAISCTPSYPKVMAKVLAKQGKSAQSLGLKLALFGGEAGLDSEAFRQRIVDEWGMQPRNANYGVSDVLSNFAAQCEHQTALHFLAADVLYPELIDPNTAQALNIEDGAEGELVLTHLQKDCQPLVRFRSGDIIRIEDTDACACGRSGFRFRVIGRSDDMVVVRGLNVFPTQISAVLNTLPALSGEYQIRLCGNGPYDHLPLTVELGEKQPKSPELIREIEAHIHRHIRITARVSLVSHNTLPRTDGKTRRVIREPAQ